MQVSCNSSQFYVNNKLVDLVPEIKNSNLIEVNMI